MSVDSFFLASGNSPGTFPSTPCRVAVLGFGTVGSAVAARLAGADPVDGLELTHILDRRASAKRDELAASRAALRGNIIWTTNVGDILASNADIVADAISGTQPAAEWIRAALVACKSVVTAHKQVIAHHVS